MTLHNFYRAYEALTKEERFQLIESTLEPTSLFVIFQQLGQVRSQKRYFEDREAHLLELAQIGFNKLKDKNG
jgi:hypothetical protein